MKKFEDKEVLEALKSRIRNGTVENTDGERDFLVEAWREVEEIKAGLIKKTKKNIKEKWCLERQGSG